MCVFIIVVCKKIVGWVVKDKFFINSIGLWILIKIFVMKKDMLLEVLIVIKKFL